MQTEHVGCVITYCSYRCCSFLTWHNEAISSDQLWVKLEGDKGHGSFKFDLQLVNTKRPNSIKATTLSGQGTAPLISCREHV